MATRSIKVKIYQCNQCSHEWQKRQAEEPLICPKCKSARWDRPRRKKV